MSNQLSLTDLLTFGKWRGASLKEVIEEDITYVEWALDEVSFFELDDRASEFYDETIDRYYEEQGK